jgi:hypothetical protein
MRGGRAAVARAGAAMARDDPAVLDLRERGSPFVGRVNGRAPAGGPRVSNDVVVLPDKRRSTDVLLWVCPGASRTCGYNPPPQVAWSAPGHFPYPFFS